MVERSWRSRERWQLVLLRGERTHGYHWLGDLLECGFTKNEVRGLVTRMQLEGTRTRGLYRIAGLPVTYQSTLYEWTLSTKGAASHLSAAMLHGLGQPMDLTPGFAEITAARQLQAKAVPSEGRRVKVYGTSQFNRIEVEAIDDIPCVPIHHCLLDLAAEHPVTTFKSCFNVALRRRQVTVESLLSSAEKDYRRRGVRRMQTALSLLRAEDRPAQSEWSIWALDRILAAGLPRPELEARIFDADGRFVAQVDLYWPGEKLVVELDSREFHIDNFEKDRARDAALAGLGITVIRITWKQYMNDGYLVEVLRRALGQRGTTI